LVKELAQDMGLKFKLAANYHTSFVTMPGYYPTVDCIICPSMNEGAGLPVLEAGAAGKLVLTTPVGHYPEKVGPQGAIPLPYDEKLFKEATSKLIKYYVKNSKEYRKKCEQIQEHAKYYDWKYNIDYWVKFILDQSTDS
jgi:glycosyltransferase involved in cell wall biosynthesis